MIEVERTLVKSLPELWQVLDSTERMEAWLTELSGSPDGATVTVTAREPERRLAWRGEGDSVEVSLEKKGWGTHVTVRSEHGEPAAIERLLDDLGTAHRRPFSRI